MFKYAKSVLFLILHKIQMMIIQVIESYNCKRNKSISDSRVELCEINNRNDFHQTLTNAIIT